MMRDRTASTPSESNNKKEDDRRRDDEEERAIAVGDLRLLGGGLVVGRLVVRLRLTIALRGSGILLVVSLLQSEP